MIGPIYSRVIGILAGWECVTLVTCGPAGPQISIVKCRAVDAALYLLVQRVSDHLFNLEQPGEVVLRAAGWEVRGQASILTEIPDALAHAPAGQRPRQPWEVWVAVRPARMQRLSEDGLSTLETIDW